MPRSQSAGQYDPLISAAARHYNVDPRLIRAVLQQESGLGRDTKASLPNDPDSPIGLAQIRPSTLRSLLGPDADPHDPATAIMGAAAYLDQGMKTAEGAGYKNPGAFAVAHYFAGPDLQQWGPKTAGYVQNVAGLLRGSPGGAEPGGGLNIGVGPQAGSISKVDPRLLDIVNQASTFLQPGWHAEIISGHRASDEKLGGTSLHPYGAAVDVQLYGPDGKPVPNYQSPQNFRTYEQFAQVAKKIQATSYPELDDKFSWGGYFHSGGMPNYGANDLMHLSVGAEHGAAGTWEGGLNDTGKQAGFDKGGMPSAGMGDVAAWQMPVAPPGRVPPQVQTAAARPVQLASAGVSDMPLTGQVPGQAAAARPDQAAAPGGGNLDIAMLNVPELGLAAPQAAPRLAGGRAMPSPAPQRVLSDEELGHVGPADVLGLVSREDLTDADRMALQRRLEALGGQ